MTPLDDPLYHAYESREEALQASAVQLQMMSDVLGTIDSVLEATGADTLALATRETQTGMAFIALARAPLPLPARIALFFAGSILATKGTADGAMLAADQLSVGLGCPHVPGLNDIFFPKEKNDSGRQKAEKAAAQLARNRLMDSIAKRGGTFVRRGTLPSRATVETLRDWIDKGKRAADASLAKQNANGKRIDRASLSFDYPGNGAMGSSDTRVDKDHGALPTTNTTRNAISGGVQ